MRFSLGTFVLIILFIASAYAVWWFNEPWYFAQTLHPKTVEEWQNIYFAGYARDVSPDGKCIILAINPDGTVVKELRRPSEVPLSLYMLGIFENKPDGALVKALPKIPVPNAVFKSNSTVYLNSSNPTQGQMGLHVFKRRYSDSLVGYLARPECLMLAATFALLCAQCFSHLRKRKNVR